MKVWKQQLLDALSSEWYTKKVCDSVQRERKEDLVHSSIRRIAIRSQSKRQRKRKLCVSFDKATADNPYGYSATDNVS